MIPPFFFRRDACLELRPGRDEEEAEKILRLIRSVLMMVGFASWVYETLVVSPNRRFQFHKHGQLLMLDRPLALRLRLGPWAAFGGRIVH